MSCEGEWRELGQRDRRSGVHGRNQLPQRFSAPGDGARVGLDPERLQNEAGQRSVRPLVVE